MEVLGSPDGSAMVVPGLSEVWRGEGVEAAVSSRGSIFTSLWAATAEERDPWETLVCESSVVVPVFARLCFG